ncbi:hypothetical protein KY290_020373 [Solanum tuberosum]|uniref:Uncharacterized protein n=1 Tax=Solanum tuberosum TaxID=4113 RepID=A0ABQ7V1L0_SOLTU|nr:hypothetical protein KY290_020373 [Solanum tuberosum]
MNRIISIFDSIFDICFCNFRYFDSVFDPLLKWQKLPFPLPTSSRLQTTATATVSATSSTQQPPVDQQVAIAQQQSGHLDHNAQNQRFQPNYRSAKGKGIAANACGTDDTLNAERNDGPSHYSNPNLTKDQYEQLISMMQQFQMNNAGETNEDQMSSGAVNFAGPFNEEASGDW